MDKLVKAGEGSADYTLVQLGPGLPALSKKLGGKIEAGEYANFNDLPPAKGKGRLLSQALEGQIVVVQATDLAQSRWHIPYLATWVQCFGLYAAVVARQKLEKMNELLAYQAAM